MAEPLDPAKYVPEAATAVGLTIAPEDLGDVINAFVVLARAAGQVMAAPLPEELVAAAVFAPDDGEKR
jgi:1-carboxybiuret hydrolase subunit AtzG-like protein